MTALHWAVTYKHNAAVVKLLLEAGADAEARDEEGLTPRDITTNKSILRLLY